MGQDGYEGFETALQLWGQLAKGRCMGSATEAEELTGK
jgi:hypothetical protein